MRVRYGGFTLIELMVTIVIVAILLALAVPSFTSTISRSRVASGASSLSVAFSTARSEAVKRGRNVTICKSADVTATPPACTTSGDWSQGWIVFDATVSPIVPIKVFEAMSSGVTAAGGAEVVSSVTFAPNGATTLAGAGSDNPNRAITVCKPGVNSRVVTLSASGRVSVLEGAVCT